MKKIFELNFTVLSDIAKTLSNLSFEELADKAGIGKENFKKYRSGERNPRCTAEKLFFDWFDVSDDKKQLSLTQFIMELNKKKCFPDSKYGYDEYRSKTYSKGDYNKFIIGCIEIALNNSKKTIKKQANTSINTEEQFSYINKISPFIRSNFKKYLDVGNIGFDDIYNKYSNLFGLISTLKFNKQILKIDKLLNNLFSIIINEESKTPNILKIIGPTGSGKSTIIQLLFIKLLRHIYKNKQMRILPFLLDLVYLENLKYTSEKTFEEQVTIFLREMIHEYRYQCHQNPEMRRIVFISGIHNYQWSEPSIDYVIKKELSGLDNLQYVVSVDTDLIINSLRIRRDIPLAPMTFSYALNIESVDLSEEEKAKQYLSCYKTINMDDTQQQDLYIKLVKMEFNSIDIYQLKLLKTTIYDKFDDPSFNISELYESYCLNFLNGNKKPMEETARVAFEFAYTDKINNDKDNYVQPYWKLIRSHSSFIDFFISRYYIKKLSEYDNNSSLNDFEMILPKTVTCFVKPQLNKSFAYEQRIIKLCESKYKSMGICGKSSMIYWLGRICSPNLTDKSCDLLKIYYREINEQLEINKNNFDYSSQKMIDDLFVLRGITVSLIYKQVPKISDQYIHSMLEDNTISSINRGFHLEYYGDKEYVPIHNTLNYEDDLEVGDKTLRQLIKVNEVDFNLGKFSPSFELKLFTICSLLQARIENKELQLKFDINPFINKAINMVEEYLKIGYCKDEKIVFYFKSVLIDFIEHKANSYENRQLMSVRLYNKYSKANRIKRTGWVIHKITDAENIIEHTYNCWLMGLLVLPDKIEDEPLYSKQDVLEMILIHDIGECETGDILKKEKLKDPSLKEKENAIMKMLFLKGTYPSMPNLSKQYKLWTEWYEQETFNSWVAKDIDVIQAIYQLCTYLSEYRNNFTKETLENWFKGHNELKTNIGKTIFKNLIVSNDDFNYICFKEFLI